MWGRRQEARSYNVQLALWWALLEGCSESIRSGDAFSALLYLLTRSNTTVGIVQGCNGLAQMLSALPAGWLADRHRRDTLLRVGSGVGAAAAAVLAAALVLRPDAVWALAAASILLGAYRGVYSAALEALFADSVAPGRSSPYTRKYAITVAASSVGPWLSLLVFHRLGDRWHADDCRVVLLCGVALMAFPLALMCCFDDDRAAAARLPQHAQQEQQQQGEQQQQEEQRPANSCAADGSSSLLPAAASDGDLVSLLDGPDGALPEGGSGRGCCAAMPTGLVVAILISVSDLLGAFASGMTLKFFSLFFIQQLHLRPTAVSLVSALSPLGVAAASLACQRLCGAVGRVQISLATRALDITLLVLLARMPVDGPSAAPHAALLSVHLIRMAFANATRPLMRSVLMDFVPRRHRAKVSAVDSVRAGSWSGSAALGGYLIERLGFQQTFLITAAVKSVAWLPLFALLAYVPDGVGVPPGARAARLARQRAAWPRRRAAKAAGSASDLRQPLLGGAGGSPAAAAAAASGT